MGVHQDFGVFEPHPLNNSHLMNRSDLHINSTFFLSHFHDRMPRIC